MLLSFPVHLKVFVLRYKGLMSCSVEARSAIKQAMPERILFYQMPPRGFEPRSPPPQGEILSAEL